MALNFMGLGFSFGVEDLKLKDFQASVSEGFIDMSEQAAAAVESVKPFVPSFEGVVPQIDAASDAMTGFGDSAVEAIERAGDELKRGKEQWSEFKDGVTDTVEEWKQGFAEIGQELKQDVVAGFEQVNGAARGLYQDTGLEQLGMAMTDLKDRAVETGHAVYEAADKAFGISRAVEPVRAVAQSAWEAAKGFLGMADAAEAANRAATAIDPKMSTEGVRGLDQAVQDSTTTFDHDLPVAMEKASRSYHKESTRILVDSEHIQKMFRQIKEVGDSLKSLVSLSKLQTVFQGIGTGLLSQLSRMRSGVGSLLNANVNLTTSLEAEGVQLAKSAKSTAAQMGYTGRELRRVSGEAAGMAAGLNIGADTAVKAIYNFNWASEQLKAVGITNARQAAKATEALGIDMTVLAGGMRKATEQFGLTSDQAGQLVQSLHSFGAAGGVATEMVQALPEFLDAAAGATDRYGRLLQGADFQDFALGTVAASRGLYEFTQNAQEAKDIAKGIARSLIDSREQWNQLQDGVEGGQFPEMAQQMMRFGLDVGDTFKLMGSSPEGFVRAMANIQKQIKANSATEEEYAFNMRRMRGYLSKVVPPEAAQMIERMGQRWEVSGDAMLSAMDEVKTARVDLGKLADQAHSTGRTLQEEFDRMKEAGVMGFRAISRQAAVTFVKDTGKAFGVFNKRLKQIAERDDFLGKIVQKLSLMHQIGAYALIPQALRPMAVLFGEIGSQVLPLVGSLAPIVGGLAPALIGMGGPMMAVTAIAGAMVLPLTVLGLRMGQLMLEGKSFGEALNQLGKDIQNFANTALDKLGSSVDWVYEKFSKVDWKAMFGKVFDAIKAVFTGDFDLLGSLFGADQAGAAQSRMAGIADKIKSMVVTLKDSFVSAVQEADWGAIAMGLLDKLVFVFIELPNKLFRKVMSIDFASVATGVIENLSESFASGGAGAGNLFVRIFAGLAEAASRGTQLVVKALSSAFQVFAKLDWGKVLGNLWEGLKGAFAGGAGAVAGIGEGIWNWLKGAFQWVVAQAPKAAKWLQTAIPKIVDTAVAGMSMGESFISKLQDWVLGAVDTLGEWIKKGLEWLWDKVPTWLGSVADWFAGINWVELGGKLLKGLLSLWATAMTWIPKMQVKILDTLVGALTWVLEKIPPAVDKYLPKALEFIDKLPDMIEKMLSGEDTGDAAGGFVGKLFGKFADVFVKLWPVLVKLVTKLVPALVQTVVKLVGAAIPLFLKLMPVLYNIFAKIWVYVMDTAKNFVVGLLDTIKQWFQKKFPALAGPIGVVFEVIKVGVKVVFEIFKWFWWGVAKGFEYLWKIIGGVLGLVWEGLKAAGSVIAWLAGKAWDAVKAIGAGLAWAWEQAKSAFTKIADFIGKVWSVAKAAFTMMWKIAKAAFEMLWAIAEPVVTAVYELFQSAFNWIWKKVVEPTTKWIVDKFVWIWNKAKTIFKGIYDTVKMWFDKVYTVVSGIFTRIQQMWQGSWNELKKILTAWFDWVNSKVELIKTKLKEVFDGLKEKAEKAMESLKEVMEKPFNILKDTISSVWGIAKGVLLKIWGALKAVITGAQGMLGTAVKWMLGQLMELVKPFTRIPVVGQIATSMRTSIEKAGEEMVNFRQKASAAFDVFQKEVDEKFGHSWDKQVGASVDRAVTQTDRFGDQGSAALERFQSVAEQLGLDISGMDPAVVQKMAEALSPAATTDVMQTALVRPWEMAEEAANRYSKTAMDTFQKVFYGAQQFSEALQSTLGAGIQTSAVLSMQAMATPQPGRADTRRRDLEELAQGPMREILAATNNPAWYSDWRATFLRAHEEMKAEIRALRGTPAGQERRNAQARPIPPSDPLAAWGMRNGGTVGVS